MALSMSNPVLSGAGASAGMGKPFLQRTQAQQPNRDLAAPNAQPKTTPVRQGPTESLPTEGVASRRAIQPIKVPFEPLMSAVEQKPNDAIEQPICRPPAQEPKTFSPGVGSFVNLRA